MSHPSFASEADSATAMPGSSLLPPPIPRSTLANTDTVTFPLSFYDDITAFQSRTIPVAREGVPAELPRYRHTIGFRGPAQDGPCNVNGKFSCPRDGVPRDTSQTTGKYG